MIPVEPIISAAGFNTAVGGGTMSPAARAAIAEAAESTWRIDDLQAWAGSAIAEVTGAESGWVTAGASAALTVAAAACIAGGDPARLAALPQPADGRREILVQRGHRNAYDRVVRTAGATIVDVGFPYNEGVGLTYEWELEGALSERTAAILHVAVAEPAGVPLRRVCEIAARHDVPVIVDAAAELPPVENLRAFVDAGATLVAFSGGKGIRGPQASGVLAGPAEAIAAVRLATIDLDVDVHEWREREGIEPPHHGLGRSMKVGKEEIAGLVAALREFVGRDHEAESAEHAAWLDGLAAELGGAVAGVHVDRASHFYPRLVVAAGELARPWARQLASGRPQIVVPHHPLARGELTVCPEAIVPERRDEVAAALRATVAERAPA